MGFWGTVCKALFQGNKGTNARSCGEQGYKDNNFYFGGKRKQTKLFKVNKGTAAPASLQTIPKRHKYIII